MSTFPIRPLKVPSPALLRYLKAQTTSEPWLCQRSIVLCSGRASSQSRPVSTSTRSTRFLSERSQPISVHCGSKRYSHTSSGSSSSLPTTESLLRTYHTTLRKPTPIPSAFQIRSIRLWPWSTKTKQPERLRPNDLPPLASLLDDNTPYGRIPKPSNELILKCTELDESGRVILTNGEFKKTELIAKYGLLPRDLRKIDSSLLPHVLVRPSAILINLLHLRVLIQHNRVLIFEPYGSTDSYTQSSFIYDLENRLQQKESTTQQSSGQTPYEFRALEAVLISVTAGLESEFEGVRTPVVRVLRALEEDIDREKLRYLLVWAKKLGTFEQKARLVRDAVEELLEADDDLAAMYLSEKSRGVEREEDDHAEVEMLLESYHRVTDEIVQAAENLVGNIRNTEEIVKAILDANRNSLMLLELKFSIGTLGLSAGTFIAALYGMNLKNFIEESDFGFWGVSAACGVIAVVVLLGSLRKLRTVQRLSMWGEGGNGMARERGSWRDLGASGGLGLGSGVRDGATGSALGPGAGTAGLGMAGRLERMRWEGAKRAMGGGSRAQVNPTLKGHGSGHQQHGRERRKEDWAWNDDD